MRVSFLRACAVPAAVAIVLAGALAGSVRAAAAQPPAPSGFIAINGGVRSSGDFSDSVVFPESGGVYADRLSGAAAQEQARFDGVYRVDGGTLFDAIGGVRIWRRFGLGAGVSRHAAGVAASVSAQAPHPFHFGRDRSMAGSALVMRDETAFHLLAFASASAGRSLTVTVFGGPTLVSVEQELITDVRFSHDYPYDTAAFSGVMTAAARQSKVGFSVGADVAYYFSAYAGVGLLTRYSRVGVELPSVDGNPIGIAAGGLHAAGGLRLRF